MTTNAEEPAEPLPPLRTFGTMPNLLVPDDLDAPLPADELAGWEGTDDDGL